MFSGFDFILGWLQRLGASRSDLLIESLALCQQLAPDATAGGVWLLTVLEACGQTRAEEAADRGVGAVQRGGGGGGAECVRLAAPSATFLFFGAVLRRGSRARPPTAAVEEVAFSVGEAHAMDHRIPFVRRRFGLS